MEQASYRRMISMKLEVEIAGSLFKTLVKDMPTLYYFLTPLGVFCWAKEEGWHMTSWKSFEDLKEYFEQEQKGKISPSNELNFLLHTGRSVYETFMEGKKEVVDDGI